MTTSLQYSSRARIRNRREESMTSLCWISASVGDFHRARVPCDTFVPSNVFTTTRRWWDPGSNLREDVLSVGLLQTELQHRLVVAGTHFSDGTIPFGIPTFGVIICMFAGCKIVEVPNLFGMAVLESHCVSKYAAYCSNGMVWYSRV